MGESVFCSKCGSQTIDGAEFCSSCGYKLVENKKTRKNGKINKVLIAVAVILVVVAVVIGISFYNSNNDFIPTVRAWRPFDISQGMPGRLGDVIDAIYPSAEWNNEKINGDYFVTISAKFMDYNENEVEIVLKIKVVPDGDMANMTPYSLNSKYTGGSSSYIGTGYEDIHVADYLFDLFVAYNEKLDSDYILAIEKIKELGNGGLTHYSNEYMGVAFDYPKLLELELNEEGTMISCSIESEYELCSASFYVCPWVIDTFDVLNSDFDTIKQKFEKEGATVLDNGEVQLGEVKAKFIKYCNQDGCIIQDYYYDFGARDYSGLIRCCCDEKISSLYESFFENIIESFYVIETYTDVASNDKLDFEKLWGAFFSEDGSRISVWQYHNESEAFGWSEVERKESENVWYYDLYQYEGDCITSNYGDFFPELCRYEYVSFDGDDIVYYFEFYYDFFVDEDGKLGFNYYGYSPRFGEPWFIDTYYRLENFGM